MGKAQDSINSGMTSIQSAINNLQQAMSCCEKQENKTIIQSAINSMNSACNQLSNYRD